MDSEALSELLGQPVQLVETNVFDGPRVTTSNLVLPRRRSSDEAAAHLLTSAAVATAKAGRI